MKKIRINIGVIYFITLIYLELIFRILCTEQFFPITMLHNFLYLIPLTAGLTIFSAIFKEKINNIISKIILFLLGLCFSVAVVFERKFGVFFSITSMGLADQLQSFMKDTLATIANNIIYILLLFIPFIISIIFRKKINTPKFTLKNHGITLLIGIIGYGVFFASLFIDNEAIYSVYNLYTNVNNHSLTVEKIGVIPSTLIELRRELFGFEEDLTNNIFIDPNNTPDIQEEGDKPIVYNTVDIDFESLINNTKDETLITMNNYFKNDPGTKQHQYTGLYEGKNLIVFMAESFNSIGVSKELTPTLYKLTNEGFAFENFYSPVVLSTIGGEFQELTGLYPHLNLLTNIWRKGTNYYPYGFANVFASMGYNTFAYHNNQYNFQSRDKYLASLGFKNYLGCYNGLEKRINCNLWPASDEEMISKTVSDYVNSDKPFMTYYATISGHMSYDWYNKMAAKHRDKVEDLPYSTKVKAYLATQIELDLALETLITQLEAAGQLENTVIALVADHYPYDLTLDEINEVSTYERDGIVEINRSNFILWNSETQTVRISKVGSQIDVLPTILNLFGAEYDSRLIMGKDILSDTEGLAFFSNGSWVSDKGTYQANQGKFYPREGTSVDDEYIERINKIVQTRKTMSKLILEKNYYKYVFNK